MSKLTGKIRAFRVKNEMTLYDMAKAIGVSSARLSQFECGNVGLNVNECEKLISIINEPQVEWPTVDSIFKDAIEEAKRAMVKYPQPNYVLCKVAEESGEVVQAAVHCVERRAEYSKLRSEIVQNIAMLVRLVVEGDQVVGVKPLSENQGDE